MGRLKDLNLCRKSSPQAAKKRSHKTITGTGVKPERATNTNPILFIISLNDDYNNDM